MSFNRWILLTIVVMGALLRFGGMGYGLSRHESYHPDTLKQVRAVDQFLLGERYMHVGARDYDGYPLFTSYLTSRLLAVYWPVAQKTLRWIGGDYGEQRPSVWVQAWTMAMLNATLATAAILLAWWIGRRAIGEKAGLCAALFLALSPGDIAACHYATGDTGAAFFTLLALHFSLRMYREGRAVDYAAAAFFAAWAFACKYHALVAAAPVGLAHLLRPEHIRRWHRPASLRMIGLLGLAYVAGLYLAIPGLRTHPVEMVRDIVNFMRYASSFGTPPELMEAGFRAKLLFSLQRNLPILAGMLSLPLVVAAGMGQVQSRRDAATWLLLAGPAVYFLVGVSLRPYAHPVYHTVLTAPFFLLAARGLANWARAGLPTRVLAGATAFASLTLLGHAGWRETFFFRHSDTRYIARAWSEENIPPGYMYAPRVYTFESDYFTGTATNAEGYFFFTSSPRNQRVPPGFHPLVTFSMENDSLPFFRNFELPLMLHEGSSIRTNPLVPIYQRAPSRAAMAEVPAYAPEFARSGRIFELGKFDEVERLVVSREPIGEVLVVAWGDGHESRCEGQFGGRRFDLRIPAGGTAKQWLAPPRRMFPWSRSHRFHELEVRSTRGRFRVEFAWKPRDKALALLHSGRPGEALPHLREAARVEPNPTLAALCLVTADEVKQPLPADEEARCRMRAGPGTRFAGVDPLTPSWRMADRVFTQLPFLKFPAGMLESETFEQRVRWTEEGQRVEEFHSRPDADSCVVSKYSIWLEPGVYRLKVRMHTEADANPSPARITLRDHAGVVFETTAAWNKVIEAEVPLNRMFCDGELRMEFARGTSVVIDGVSIRPAAVATLRSLWERIPPPR